MLFLILFIYLGDHILNDNFVLKILVRKYSIKIV